MGRRGPFREMLMGGEKLDLGKELAEVLGSCLPLVPQKGRKACRRFVAEASQLAPG